MNKIDMKLRLGFLACVLGCASAAWAQSEVAPSKVAPSELAPSEQDYLPSAAAVRATLDASPAVAAARAMRESATARAEGIRAGSAEYVVRAIRQNRFVREPSDNFAEGQLAIERPLRLWGKSDADAALAEATLNQSEIALDDAEHETARQMLALWFKLLRTRQASAAVARSASLAGELVALTGKRVRAGDAAPMDLEIAQAEEARARAALAGARTAQDAAQAELRARFPALGLPGEAQSLLALPAAPGNGVDSSTRTRFLQANHALRLALADEAIAQRSARRSDLERKPDPTVGAFVIVERGGAERIAGLSVSMPLGSVHRRSAAAAAAADAQASARRRALVEQTVGAEFDVLVRTVTGLDQAARAHQAALALDQSAADRAGRAYAAGEISIGQLLVVRRGLSETSLATYAALVDALEAREKLRLELHQGSRFESH